MGWKSIEEYSTTIRRLVQYWKVPQACPAEAGTRAQELNCDTWERGTGCRFLVRSKRTCLQSLYIAHTFSSGKIDLLSALKFFPSPPFFLFCAPMIHTCLIMLKRANFGLAFCVFFFALYLVTIGFHYMATHKCIMLLL